MPSSEFGSVGISGYWPLATMTAGAASGKHIYLDKQLPGDQAAGLQARAQPALYQRLNPRNRIFFELGVPFFTGLRLVDILIIHCPLRFDIDQHDRTDNILVDGVSDPVR